MGSHFKIALVFAIGFMILINFDGCVSYKFSRQVRGLEVKAPEDTLKAGSTTLGEVLSIYGAPDRIGELDDQDLLIYERIIYTNSGLSIGIPFGDFPKPELSANEGLGRYDTLAIFFTSDHIVSSIVYTKDSAYPYLKTLLEKKSHPDDYNGEKHENRNGTP
jgi:hypothetical protein